MGLKKEKVRMAELVNCAKAVHEFEAFDMGKRSYYMLYADSKHTQDILCVFESEEMGDLRKRLVQLWKDNDSAKKFIPILLAAYRKTKDDTIGKFHDIEIYNYMM